MFSSEAVKIQNPASDRARKHLLCIELGVFPQKAAVWPCGEVAPWPRKCRHASGKPGLGKWRPAPLTLLLGRAGQEAGTERLRF